MGNSIIESGDSVEIVGRNSVLHAGFILGRLSKKNRHSFDHGIQRGDGCHVNFRTGVEKSRPKMWIRQSVEHQTRVFTNPLQSGLQVLVSSDKDRDIDMGVRMRKRCDRRLGDRVKRFPGGIRDKMKMLLRRHDIRSRISIIGDHGLSGKQGKALVREGVQILWISVIAGINRCLRDKGCEELGFHRHVNRCDGPIWESVDNFNRVESSLDKFDALK